ncbi:oxytocin receptor-like [Branchiostoma lanceolatum]|uniref:oxytocin receptor-like n=1 Tax=Branchiostoma lanceolatum TaxID=7740 RepID=UPI0034572A4B
MADGDPFAAPVQQWPEFVPANSTDSPPTPFLLNASYRELGPTTAGPNATAWEDDIAYNRHSRVIALGVLFTAGLCGNLCVCNWMRVHRKKKSRHNTFVLNLTVADLLVTLITVLSQIIWELMEDAWMALDVGCRVVKFGQVFAIIASSNMIVLLALDRHNVIIKPFSSRWRPWKITAAGWVVSLLLAAPQAYVFREVQDEDGVPYCRSIFSSRPAWHLQIYIIYGATVVFVVPFCILSYTYSRVLAKVWIRARAGSPRELERKAGGSKKTHRRVSCVAQAGNLLPRAKVKTLKMTLVIIMAFVLCGLPYFIVEIKVAFGGMSQLDMDVYAVLGVFAVANSAVNPFVFLFFNSNNKFIHSLEQKCCFSCLSKKRVREGVKRMEVVIASWSPSRRASRPSVSLRASRPGGRTLSANL